MLFQSLPFLFVFLPVALLGYHLARTDGMAKGWLILASLAFYGYWDRRLLPLLIVAACVTWIAARLALRRRQPRWLIAGTAGNLLLLGFFKYTNFLLENLVVVTGTPFPRFNIVLPLAISFFTFHQVSYLIDVWRKQAGYYRFDDYLLYIAFFPHLIAGPIVRHYEFMPQIGSARRSCTAELAARGLGLFALGLAKKIWIADPLSTVADGIFAHWLRNSPKPTSKLL